MKLIPIFRVSTYHKLYKDLNFHSLTHEYPRSLIPLLISRDTLHRYLMESQLEHLCE